MVTIVNVRDMVVELQAQPSNRYQLLILHSIIDVIKYYQKKGYEALLIGKKAYHGFGDGKDVTLGFIESKDEIINQIKGDNVILIGRLGDSMCKGISIIAEELKKLNKKVYIIITTPFKFEGPIRNKRAIETLEEIKKLNYKYEIINNDNVYIDKKLSLLELFRAGEQIITNRIEELVKEMEK